MKCSISLNLRKQSNAFGYFPNECGITKLFENFKILQSAARKSSYTVLNAHK